MGDFSRDTFRETNVLHQTLSGETVAECTRQALMRKKPKD